MRTLKHFMLTLAVVATGVFVYASLVSAAGLTVKAKDGLGSYLADDKGMTLYLFKKDAPGKSACGAANGCLEKWPVFYAENVDPAAGIDRAAIGVITREDGKKQNTYRGLPLYYFVKDKAAGDTLGQGVNNVWFVVSP